MTSGDRQIPIGLTKKNAHKFSDCRHKGHIPNIWNGNIKLFVVHRFFYAKVRFAIVDSSSKSTKSTDQINFVSPQMQYEKHGEHGPY